MIKYHKIQSVYLRDPETKYQTFLEGQYSMPEFEYLKDNEWEFTEKVDGTSIRVIWNGASLSFKGKSDNAQIPQFLFKALEDMFIPFSLEIAEMFNETPVCFYGEGYGPKIQKGGGNYRKDNSFVLFDIMCEGMWFTRQKCEDIAESLGIDIVPILGYGNLDKGIEFAKDGFKSTWGDFTAEGIVAKPKQPLLTRRGERVITKIKHKDFQ